MKTLFLSAREHHGEWIALFKFDRDEGILADLRQTFPTLRWSQTHIGWYTAYDKGIKAKVFEVFRGRIWLNYSAFYLPIMLEKEKPNPQKELGQLNELHRNSLTKFERYLSSKRYSDATIKVYREAVQVFLRFFHLKPLEDIENADIEVFNNEYILKNGYSSSYQNQVVNGLKLFFKVVQARYLMPEIIERPRREHRLPNVLSKEEVKAILGAPKNIKHKMMLSLIYACGLRRSELLHLKITDIHSERKLLIIKQSKGKKDRVVPLSERLIVSLREYYQAFKPVKWLFEGHKRGEQYSAKSLQNVLKQSLERANIAKPVTLHWLRHSYGTHLLENGTDLRYIQELLGHSSSRTTEIYTHVSTRNIQKIISPFDTL